MFSNHLSSNDFLKACLAAVFAIGLTACSSSDTPEMTQDPDPEPTAYEMALEAIEAAETAEAAQAAYDAVKDDVTAAEGERLQTAVDDRVSEIQMAARVETQKMALTGAAGMIDTSDLSTAEAIADATNAINMLQAALDAAADVSDADKAMYQTLLDNAEDAVTTAQTDLDTAGRMMTQRMTISNAVTMARTAVNGVKNTSTDSEVSAADQAVTALETAIAGAEDLPEGDTDVASARGTLATLKAQLNTAKTARTAYLATKADEDMKAMNKLGKDLHAALAGPGATDTALDNIDLTVPDTDLSNGLSINAVAGAGSLATATNPDSVTLKAGDSVTALDGWEGMDYAHTNTGTKVVNEARVYNNQGAPKSVEFAKALPTGVTIATATDSDASALKGYLLVAIAGTVETELDIGKVTGAIFTHAGTQTHTYDEDSVRAFTARGYYDGAPGMYRCVDATGSACASTNDGEGAPSVLAGTWHFKPDSGAMVSQPDANYLYYGWWVSKDKDGVPTAASAFTGVNGTIAALTANPTTLAGSATYAGNAAGKFAMSNPLDGTGSGGHFTAEVELTAKFGAIPPDANNGGVSGTIDNFMANGESVPWSVALHLAPWGTDAGAFTSTSDATDTTANGTTWSIDGNSAPESGTWSGQMYDELPGDTDATPAGDGSNVPTTVTGKFYSEFGTIGRMVGAFGADQQ